MRKVLLIYISGAAAAVALFAFVAPTLVPLYEGKTLLFGAAAAGVLLTMMFWAGRVLVRLYLSELHLAGDAWERATMAKTYLALTKEGQATEDDRVIILGALFRQTSDGVVKEDAAPDPSALAMLARFLDRKP